MRRGRPRHDDILTPREWQVLELIAQGQSNPEIAESLGISLSGVKYHVSEILLKLEVENREGAARFLRMHRDRAFAISTPGLLLRRLSPAGSTPLPLIVAMIAAITVLVGAAVLGLAGVGGSGERLSSDNIELKRHLEELDAEAVGLDLPAEERQGVAAKAPAPILPNTLLLTRDIPANAGSAANTLAAMQRVGSVAELQAALHPGINLIVVDRSALGELAGSDVLYEQLQAGRALIGLNITDSELRAVSDFHRHVNEIRPGGAGPLPPVNRIPSLPERGFYSSLIYKVTPAEPPAGDGPVYVLDSSQRYFFEELFTASVLEFDTDSYRWREPDLRVVTMAEVLVERVDVNRGMGCAALDDAKTAAVAKRELLKTHAGVQLFGFAILYCNPGDDGTVILGASLHVPSAAPTLALPPDCLGRPGDPQRSVCTPQPSPGSPKVLVQITVQRSELVP